MVFVLYVSPLQELSLAVRPQRFRLQALPVREELPASQQRLIVLQKGF